VEAAAFRDLATNETSGWYYQARQTIVHLLLKRYFLTGKILDVGCGTGGTTQSLRKFGEVVGLEPSPLARQLCAERYPDLKVVAGGVEELTTLFQPNSFNAVVILGVLYHKDVANPAEALRAIAELLAPGGILIWNDATYPKLARGHDRFTQAGRRFLPSEMAELCVSAGLEVKLSLPLLSWAYPVARLLAWVEGRSKRVPETSADDRPLPKLVGTVLQSLTVFEFLVHQALRGIWRFGVSQIIVAQRTSHR
jgi:SAM-dependent methyltransferase